MIVEHGCQNRLQQKILYSTVSTKRLGWYTTKKRTVLHETTRGTGGT